LIKLVENEYFLRFNDVIMSEKVRRLTYSEDTKKELAVNLLFLRTSLLWDKIQLKKIVSKDTPTRGDM